MNNNENQQLLINLNPNNIKYNINNPININNQPNLILNKKNIDDDSLFDISYSYPKRQNNNIFKINNYISNEKQKTHMYINNNNMQDQRLFFTLKMLGLNKYYMKFVQNKLNFEGLLAVSNNDMDLMGIPKNYQRIIRTFISDYFQFGSLYTLDELKQYFMKRNYSKGHRTIKRSYSYNFQGNQAKRIKNNINSQINLRNQKQAQYNNYNREFDKRNNNYNNNINNNNIDNNMKINKSVSPLLKNNYNIYSKINMNNININNIENKINNQYIMNCNNINNEYNNKNNHNEANGLIINPNESKPFSPSLDNFKRVELEQKNFDINRMKHFSNVNKNMKKNLKQNQIKIIPKSHHSNSYKNISKKKDKIWKTLQKKKNNTNNLDYKSSINLNDDIIDNKFENRHKVYYSYNNNHRNIIKNYSDNFGDMNYYTNTANRTNPNYTNRYYNELNNNFLNKNVEYDNYTLMMPRSSSLNSKISKIKMLKMKKIKEVNQLINNSKNKGRNLYAISAKKRSMQTNNLNEGITNNNNYNFINKVNNDSISMNNYVKHNKLKIQNMKLRNKNIYYRNIDNYAFNNDYNNFSYNQLSYNLNNLNNNTYNNNYDINEIPDFFEINNRNVMRKANSGKQKFVDLMPNSTNNSRIKGLEIRYKENQEPKKLFNNNFQKNLNIIPNSNNNLNIMNSINSNDLNFIENTNDNNYINKANYNLLNSKSKKIKLRQNSTDNYFIKSFQQYYKTTQNFYNEQFQTQSKPIVHSSNKKDKLNQLVDDSSYNLINKNNNQIYKNNNKIINKNIKKANLPKYISKTQLEKIKMDIQKGFNKGNNNTRRNRNINNKKYNYNFKKQNNIYSNINNDYKNINNAEYKNNYLNYYNNFNSKNYI